MIFDMRKLSISWYGQYRDIFLQPAASDQNIRSDKTIYLWPIAAYCKSVWML